MPNTYTNTNTYTKPRTEVVRDQFEIFLTYTGVVRAERERLLASIARGELAALGAYLEKGGHRFMEVELEVDWELHALLTKTDGEMFDTDRPGWEEMASPEVNMYAHRISRVAKEQGIRVRHWIRVTREIRANPTKHKAICEALGFSFGSSVPPWPKGTPREKEVSVLDLPETKIYEREE